MIIKICQFRARRDQGERLVEVFHPGEMEKAAEFFGMGKTAAPLLPEVQNFLGGIKPEPNKIYVLVNALGAGEYWGSNINGDYFPEGALIHKGPVYGYETFYQAFPYKHHVNKDPTRSFGKVVLSCWHNEMKRVELVVCIDRDLAARFGAQDVCDKLDHGMFPDVSMGCKVPYDLCSKCLDWDKYRDAQATFDPARHKSVGVAVLEYHKVSPIRGLSVTRNDYCEHLKGQLNQILPDGIKIYAINDYPRFFDISFVFIGADKTAKVMAKLASCGHQNRVVPSWYLAEEFGYQQPAVEKGFEKAAAALPLSMKRFGKELVEGAVDRYHPERMSLKKAVGLARKARRVGEPSEEKTAGLEAVRARLRKKASQNKGAEIIKEVVPSQFGGKALPVDHGGPDLPNDVLDSLGGCPLNEALSTPTTMGMVLRPREFQRIMIISIGKKDLADKMDSEGTTFPQTGEHDLPVPVGPNHFSDVIKNMLLPLMEGRSALEPVAQRRVISISVQKSPEGANKPEEHPEESLKTAAETPFLRKIAAAYNGYLDRVADCFHGAANVINNNSDVWAAVFRSGLAEEFEKSAAGIGPVGGKVSPAVVLGAVGGAYALSEYAKYQRERSRMGAREPVGPAMSLMAEYPKLFMLLAGMGALHQQGSTIPTRIVKGLGAIGTNPEV